MIEIALSNVALYKNKKLKSNEIVLFSVALKITCLFSCKKTKRKTSTRREKRKNSCNVSLKSKALMNFECFKNEKEAQ